MSTNNRKFAIELEINSLDRTMDPITGIVFIRCGDIAFPEESWSDFPVVILGWWHQAAVSLVEGSRFEKFLFMDGPYRFEVSSGPSPAATWRGCFFRDKAVVAESDLVAAHFVGAILSAGNTLIRACMDRGWSSGDTRALSTGRVQLQRALKKRET